MPANRPMITSCALCAHRVHTCFCGAFREAHADGDRTMLTTDARAAAGPCGPDAKGYAPLAKPPAGVVVMPIAHRCRA